MIEITAEQKRFLLVEEARQWVGIQEVGGNNRGQLVEIFLASEGLDAGNPWCMAFAQRAISRVDKIAQTLNPSSLKATLNRTAHCMTVWYASPLELRSAVPVVGSLAIWHHPASDMGHTGIVSYIVDGTAFKTIEGNTGPTPGVNRDGDGVFEKTHTLHATNSLELVGFILPWV